MKEIEVRLIAELLKNSRRSDRELGKVLGISQPTVGRLIRKLEKEGIIKEYTIIPDFHKLGYSILAASRLTVTEPHTNERLKDVRGNAIEQERKNPNALLLAVDGRSIDKNRLFLVLYEDYADYVRAMKTVKALSYISVDSVDTFLADLGNERNYRVLSMSAIANHLLQRLKKNQK